MKRHRLTPTVLAPCLVLTALALTGCGHSPIDRLFGDKADEKPVAGKPADAAPGADLDTAIQAAQAQRRDGDLDGATRTLSQLVLVAPDDPRVLGEYGKTLLDKGATDDALAFLQRATELRPMDWTLFSAMGVAYAQKGNYAAATAVFGRALMLNPADPTILNNNAMAHLQAGDIAGAEALLRQAAQGGVAHPRIAQNLALVQRLRETGAPQPQTGSPPPVSAPAAVAVAPQPQPAAPVAAPQAVPVQQASAEAPAPTVAAPAAIAQTPLPEAAAARPAPAPAARKPAPVRTAAAKPAAPVKEALPKPEAPQLKAPSGSPVYVQLGSYLAEPVAATAAAKLDGAHVTSAMKDGRAVYRVQIGPLESSEAQEALARARALGFKDGFIFRQPAPAVAAASVLPLRVSDSRSE
jgi:Flp pilus assembly protein TadD